MLTSPIPQSTSRAPAVLRRGLALLAVSTLLVAACGNDSSPSTTATDDPATTTTAAGDTTAPPDEPTTLGDASTADDSRPPVDYTGFRGQPTACDGEQAEPAETREFDAPDDLGIDPSSRPTATVTTSCGELVIELDPGTAPETVNSFVFLADQGYFDGTVAHRVLSDFVVQAGDPTATGRGGPGYQVPDEFPETGFVYERGVVAMANAGSGTTGSQFFVVVGDDAGLPPAYTVLGRVVEGMDTVDAIAEVPVGPNTQGEPSTPLETVYLETVTVDAM